MMARGHLGQRNPAAQDLDQHSKAAESDSPQYAIFLGKIDADSRPTLHIAGEIIAHPKPRIWQIRDAFNDLIEVRVHSPEDENEFEYEVFYPMTTTSWAAFDEVLAAQYAKDSKRVRR
jgi:hypothetical protein